MIRLRSFYKLILLTAISLLLILPFFLHSFAQSPCPSGPNVSPEQRNTTDCISNSIGLQNIDLSGFFPNLSPNDLLGTLSTVILVALVIFLGFKILLGGLKFVRNDAQDKSKKEAIKSITNGVIGIAIAFAAYFIVLFIRAFFSNGDDQLVNCANLYYRNQQDYDKHFTAGSLSETTDVFRRCIALAGKEGLLLDQSKFLEFKKNVDVCTNLYVQANSNLFQVKDTKKLGECFTDAIKNI